MYEMRDFFRLQRHNYLRPIVRLFLQQFSQPMNRIHDLGIVHRSAVFQLIRLQSWNFWKIHYFFFGENQNFEFKNSS